MNSKILKENVQDTYKFESILGQGAFSQVVKAIKKATGEEFAVKMLSKESLSKEDILALQTEIDILSTIDHPNIVKLFEVYEDEECMYLVLELMTGGELFDRIVEKEHFSEKEAASTIRPVVDALRYCHSLGIAHRDLKPENILYATKAKDSVIKLSDFGFARFFMNNELMMTQCGTPGYVAPEVIIGKGYDCAVDYWSVGVILYVLLCGFPPFYDDDIKSLFEQIKKGIFDFPSPYWDEVSADAKGLIKKLLTVDPKKRITAEQILEDPWVIGDSTPRTNLTNVLPGIKAINARKKFKKAGDAARAVVRFSSLIDLKKKD